MELGMMREPYPSDLTDTQWNSIARLIPPPEQGGRRRETDMREVVNAIRHLLTTTCGWRKLPDCFPNRSTVRHYYDTWREAEIWQQIEATIGRVPHHVNPNSPAAEGPQKPDKGTS